MNVINEKKIVREFQKQIPQKQLNVEAKRQKFILKIYLNLYTNNTSADAKSFVAYLKHIKWTASKIRVKTEPQTLNLKIQITTI